MLWPTVLHLCGLAVITLWLRGRKSSKSQSFSPLKRFSDCIIVGPVQAIQDSVSSSIESCKTIGIVEDFLQLPVF